VAVDPNANAAYWKANNIPMAVGQTVFINRLEFTVIGIVHTEPGVTLGSITLQPVTAKV
jgi:hypothetical protein